MRPSVGHAFVENEGFMNGIHEQSKAIMHSCNQFKQYTKTHRLHDKLCFPELAKETKID